MKFTIDEEILNKYDLSVGDFMILYLGMKSLNIKSIIESLVARGLADKNLFSEGNIVVSDKVKNILSTIVIESDKNVLNKDEEFIELANELRDLYPAGRKEGTTYMWRGTTAEIVKATPNPIAADIVAPLISFRRTLL